MNGPALVLALALLATGARASEPPRVVDLNRATAEELEQLPGIGPRKVDAILELRKRRPFTRVTQLLEVKGIGKRTLERLRPWLRVDPVAPPVPPGGPSEVLGRPAPAP